jgi:hypothetical protein
MNTEMSNRIVNARVSVLSGSDDHAKHTVYWALSGNGVLFSDDQIRELEEVITAVSCGEEITGELMDMAAGLLKYGFTDSRAGEVLEMSIEKKGGVYVQA